MTLVHILLVVLAERAIDFPGKGSACILLGNHNVIDSHSFLDHLHWMLRDVRDDTQIVGQRRNLGEAKTRYDTMLLHVTFYRFSIPKILAPIRSIKTNYAHHSRPFHCNRNTSFHVSQTHTYQRKSPGTPECSPWYL